MEPPPQGPDSNSVVTPIFKGKRKVCDIPHPRCQFLLQHQPSAAVYATPEPRNAGFATPQNNSSQSMESSTTPNATVVQVGTGRAHKGCENKLYSMYTRLLCIEDFFAGISVCNIMHEYGIKSERAVRRWLVEWGNDLYDQAITWTVEKQKNVFRRRRLQT